ncbi:hypothetical protein [Aestuariivita boseongensis]|uniref:hypothetical protein n=1 Tax=Aestuariivita boseongensis TaxID=1470562 RepID=UPI0012FC1CA5|nr:hypothetical protein [Aestuariivita boseongensis]
MNQSLAVLALLMTMQADTAAAGSIRFQCLYHFACSKFGDCGSADFTLEFVIDSTTKRAVLIGNNGLATVQAYEGANSVTFLEALASGAVQTTTIADDGSSVHSRHTIIGENISNSQFIGTCTVGQ